LVSVAFMSLVREFWLRAPVMIHSDDDVATVVELGPPCPQTPALVPSSNGPLWEQMVARFGADSFKARAVDWLTGAVRIPCVEFINNNFGGLVTEWVRDTSGRNPMTTWVLWVRIHVGRFLVRSTGTLRRRSPYCRSSNACYFDPGC
jgi:hypothetical protein